MEQQRKFNTNDIGKSFSVKDDIFNNYPEYVVSIVSINEEKSTVKLAYLNGKTVETENKEWYIVKQHNSFL